MVMTTSPFLTATIEHWPLAHRFAISRGAKTEAVVVAVELGDGQHKGYGECVPYARYGETPESVLVQIETIKPLITGGLDRQGLQSAMKPGAARNAIDCAFWDIEAKKSGKRVWQLAGVSEPQPLMTVFTISLDTAAEMATAAAKVAHWPVLKIKLGREGVAERLGAIRSAVPKCDLVIDANEAWTPENLAANFAACVNAGVSLIEQPLPAADDAALASLSHPIPVCADESAHDLFSLKTLKGKYEAVNIKLDKTGGLTEALSVAREAELAGFSVMAGCMVSTSRGIAPAFCFAQKARIVDLDGPLWLAKDRLPGLRYEKERVYPPSAELWG